MASTNPFSSNNPFRRSVVAPVDASNGFGYRQPHFFSDDLLEDSDRGFSQDKSFKHNDNSGSIYTTSQFANSHDSILAPPRPSSGQSKRSFENRQYSNSSQGSSFVNRRSTNPFLDDDSSLSSADSVSQRRSNRPNMIRNSSYGETAFSPSSGVGSFGRPIPNSQRTPSPWSNQGQPSRMSVSVSPKKTAPPPPPPPPANRTSLYVPNNNDNLKLPYARPLRANSDSSLLESPREPSARSSVYREIAYDDSQHRQSMRPATDEFGNPVQRSSRSSHASSAAGEGRVSSSSNDKSKSSSASNHHSSSSSSPSKSRSTGIPTSSSEYKSKSKSRSKSKSSSSSKTKKNGEPLDKIDMLDVTGFYGGGSFHHDGPFDACRPHRNKTGTRPAPVAAFPINGPNNALSGWSNGQADGEQTVDAIFGRTEQEAYLDYNSSSMQKDKNFNPYNNMSASIGDRNKNISTSDSAIVNFDSTSRETPVHGSTTLGLGSTTFVEGAPAPRNYESSNPTDAPAAAHTLPPNKGLLRKKSLVQRLRGNRDANNTNVPPQSTTPPPFRSASNISSASTDTMIINRQNNNNNNNLSTSSPTSTSFSQSSLPVGNNNLNNHNAASGVSSLSRPSELNRAASDNTVAHSLSWTSDNDTKAKPSTGSRLLGRVKSLRVSRKSSTQA